MIEYTQSMEGVRHIDVSFENAGQRLDNFLIRELKGLPRNRVYRLLRKGEVRVNGGRINPGYRLRSGDRIRIPPMRVIPPPKSPKRIELPELPVLFEDDHVLALDKPAGLAVHGGTGLRSGLIEALREQRPDVGFLELAHRLDRGTSGCLLLAKNRATLLELHRLLRSREPGLIKEYQALLRGRIEERRFEVTAPLRKNAVKSGERMVVVDERGLSAHSVFEVLKAYRECTLVRIRLLTGRTHQARVHASHSGHPIIGDSKYGDQETNRRFRTLGVNRLCLHASRLCFKHPATGAVCELVSHPPALFEHDAITERQAKC